VARLHAAPADNAGPDRLGFWHRNGREIVEVHTCPILAPPLNRALEACARGLFVDLQQPLEARLVLGDRGPALVVSSDHPLPTVFYQRANALVPEQLLGVAFSVQGIPSQGFGRIEVRATGVDGQPFFTQAESFVQANPSVNRRIADTVTAWLQARRFNTALELFSGSGNLTVALARVVERYTASELDLDACRAAEKNLSSRGMDGVTVEPGDALAVYRALGEKTELIVLDPPRSGHRRLARAIAAGAHRAVLYVSCQPSTLARDLAELEATGYKLTEAAGFDMFPQTAHMEAAVLMER
jgi:23S rRNA (uracil1939-C5)-methyltransferase